MSFFAAQQTSLFDSAKISSSSGFNFYVGDQVSLLNGSAAQLYEITLVDGLRVALRSVASGSKRVAPTWLIRPACGIEGRGETSPKPTSGATPTPTAPEETLSTSTSGATPTPTAPEETLSTSGATPTPTAPEEKHWVETYSPSKWKQYSYYRYVWMEGRKLHHVHIKGMAGYKALTGTQHESYRIRRVQELSRRLHARCCAADRTTTTLL